MAVLSSKQREKMPQKQYALPGKRYPINDASHARNALARVSQHGTPSEKATVRAKVRKKYPGIDVSGGNSGNGKKKGLMN